MKRISLIIVIPLILINLSFTSLPNFTNISILINRNNKVLLEDDISEIKNLSKEIKNIIRDENGTYFTRKITWNIPLIGEMEISRVLITISCDRATSYDTYIKVQNQIEISYKELRNELALDCFQKPYKQLNDEQKYAVDMVYPKYIYDTNPSNLIIH